MATMTVLRKFGLCRALLLKQAHGRRQGWQHLVGEVGYGLAVPRPSWASW